MAHLERIIPDEIIDRNYWLAKEIELLKDKLYFANKEIASNSEMLNCHLKRYLFASEQLGTREVTLDIGCGVGYGSEILARHSKYVLGIDRSEDAIYIARSRYQHKNIDFVSGKAESYDYPQADGCVCFELIEHLELPTSIELLKRLRSHLGIGAKIILSTPIADDGTNPFHLRTFKVDEFDQLVSNEFAIEKKLFQSIDGNISEKFENYIYIIVATNEQ